MKCFSCGKKFNYEKYNGICPKCGSFHTNSSQQDKETDTSQKQGKTQGSFVFLAVSLTVFLAVVLGGAMITAVLAEGQKNKLKEEVLGTEAAIWDHAMGETFSFQGMTLAVTDVRVLLEIERDESETSGAKKLVAVKLSGTSSGKWSEQNQLSEAYICYDDYCYWQIANDEFEETYGDEYPIPLFGRYDLCEAIEREGFITFWLAEDQGEFTLCLEEREDVNLVVIRAIHKIEIQLKEGMEDD